MKTVYCVFDPNKGGVQNTAFTDEDDALLWIKKWTAKPTDCYVMTIYVDPKETLEQLRKTTGLWVVHSHANAFDVAYNRDIIFAANELEENNPHYIDPLNYRNGYIPNFVTPVQEAQNPYHTVFPSIRFQLLVNAEGQEEAVLKAEPILRGPTERALADQIRELRFLLQEREEELLESRL